MEDYLNGRQPQKMTLGTGAELLNTSIAVYKMIVLANNK